MNLFYTVYRFNQKVNVECNRSICHCHFKQHAPTDSPWWPWSTIKRASKWDVTQFNCNSYDHHEAAAATTESYGQIVNRYVTIGNSKLESDKQFINKRFCPILKIVKSLENPAFGNNNEDNGKFAYWWNEMMCELPHIAAYIKLKFSHF